MSRAVDMSSRASKPQVFLFKERAIHRRTKRDNEQRAKGRESEIRRGHNERGGETEKEKVKRKKEREGRERESAHPRTRNSET